MTYKPNSVKSSEISLMCSTFSTVVDGAEAVYLSAPLTTGRRFGANGLSGVPSADGATPSKSVNESLIALNREQAQVVAKRLREDLFTIVIDPTALRDVDDWNQQDYHVFWERVIKQYVRMIVFLDDWEYSNGCAYEFLVAQRMSISCFDERLSRMSLVDGLQLIQKASDCSQVWNPGSKLTQIAAELGQLSKVEDKDHALV